MYWILKGMLDDLKWRKLYEEESYTNKTIINEMKFIVLRK